MSATTMSDLQALESGLIALEAAFLPAARLPDPSKYSNIELTRAKAYLVFAHAELEDYFESISRKKAQWALSQLESRGISTRTALSLVSHFGENISIPTDMAKYQERSTRIAADMGIIANHSDTTRIQVARLKAAVSAYILESHKNHGVKEPNILRMLLPLGIDPSAIESTWIAELNSLGADRGDHSHHGLAAIQNLNDPFAPKDRMLRILEGPPGSAPPTGSPISINSLRSLDVWLS